MKWKRTKKGSKDHNKECRGVNDDEEDEDDSKLEIDESDTEDNNNIQVDDGDDAMVRLYMRISK